MHARHPISRFPLELHGCVDRGRHSGGRLTKDLGRRLGELDGRGSRRHHLPWIVCRGHRDGAERLEGVVRSQFEGDDGRWRERARTRGLNG